VNAPVSYATAEAARAYVKRVLARPPAKAPGSVYVICVPGLPRSAAWPSVSEALGKLLPGAQLLTFDDIYPASAADGLTDAARRAVLHPPLEARVERIAATARGAVVVPRKALHRETGEQRYLLGYSARMEAEGLIALGLPVLVLAPGGPLGWPDVRVHAAPPPASPRLAMEIDVPAPPAAGVVLPTVAASYQALGLPRPRPRRRPPSQPGPSRSHPGRTNGSHHHSADNRVRVLPRASHPPEVAPLPQSGIPVPMPPVGSGAVGHPR
jgi:hypothetical protein